MARPPPGTVTSQDPVPGFCPAGSLPLRRCVRTMCCAASTSTQPAPRSSSPTGGPTMSTSSTATAGAMAATRARSRPRSGDPGVRPIRTHARAVGPEPEGERWTLGPVTDHVLAAPEHPHAVLCLGRQGLGPQGDRAALLATEGAPVGQWARRLAPRKAPTRVGLDIRRFDPRRLQGERPRSVSDFGQRDRIDQRHRAVAPLHLRPAPRRAARRCREQTQAVPAGAPVVGETPAAQHDVVARDLRGRSFELGPPLRQQRIGHGGRSCVRRASAHLPEPAPRVRRIRPRRWTATRCSGRGGPAAPTRRRAG